VEIAVVDDQPGQLAGRVLWLSRVPGVTVVGLTFEQAMARGPRWRETDVAVLDGHDRRAPARRLRSAADAGVEPFPAHENFPGVRVATSIREHAGGSRPRIIMISAHARDSEIRARRIAQAGVDYVFEHYEVEQDEATFVRAILDPAGVSPCGGSTPVRFSAAVARADVAGAVASVEASPAGAMLINEELYKTRRELAWAARVLRERLGGLLPDEGAVGSGAAGGGPRRERGPRRSRLAAQLAQAFGRDLPVDPA
jgi:hypothetical protein